MKNNLPPMYRVYLKGKPYKHLGNVEAHSEAEAIEKALKGIWKGFWAEESDRPTSSDKLVAVV